MIVWLVRDRSHRIHYSTKQSARAAHEWAAKHMGYPGDRFNPKRLPECQFEYEVVWFGVDATVDDWASKCTAYVESDSPESFRVTVIDDYSRSVVYEHDFSLKQVQKYRVRA